MVRARDSEVTPGFPRRLQVSCPKLVIAQCSLTREDRPGAAGRRTGFVALLSLGNLIVASLSRPNFQPLKRGSDKWIREGGEKDLPILSHYVFTILVLVHPCHIVGRRMNSAAHTTEFDPIQPYPTIIAMFSQHLKGLAGPYDSICTTPSLPSAAEIRLL